MENRPTRVSYREGQRLRAHDLTAEQEYLVALDRAHDAMQHAPGIVAGFEVRADAIGPGLAVDQDGRVLVLEESVPLPPHLEFTTLDIWLLACEACVGTRNDRRREFARVVFRAVPLISPDGNDPVAPRAGAVYLGRIGGTPPYTSVPASEARDAAGRASMQIGPRGTRDRNAFVVNVNDDGTLTPRIALDVLGNNRFRGEVTVAPYGDDEDGPPLTINEWPAAQTRSDLTGLGLEPMIAPPSDPPVPGMYAITTGTPADPVEQLRFDLGKQVDGDLTARFTVGEADVANGPFRDWLRIDGKGGLVLSDDPLPQNVTPISLTVSGTIQRGPIKPDLADPNFTSLLKLAWLAGIREAIQKNTNISLAITAPVQSPVETEDQWSFGITVTNQNPIAVNLDSITAVVTHTAPDGSNFIKPPITVNVNAQLPANTGTTIVVTDVDGFDDPGTFSVKTQVIGKIANGAWWNEIVTATDIPILVKPVLDQSGIPAEVPASTPFLMKVRVENDDPTHALKVVLLSINQQIQNSAHLPPKTGKDFSEQHQGITMPVTVPVSVSYSWDDFPALRTFSETAEVGVDMNVAMTVRSAGSEAQAMRFDLAFDNPSDADFRVRSVTSRAFPDDPAMPPAELTKAFRRTVKAGKRATLRDLKATVPPGTRRLVVEIELEAGDQQHVVRKEFDLA